MFAVHLSCKVPYAVQPPIKNLQMFPCAVLYKYKLYFKVHPAEASDDGVLSTVLYPSSS